MCIFLSNNYKMKKYKYLLLLFIGFILFCAMTQPKQEGFSMIGICGIRPYMRRVRLMKEKGYTRLKSMITHWNAKSRLSSK
jgi:hypothetical protein